MTTTVTEPLARAGYAARGVVYLIVGFFALLAAIGSGQTKSTEGALVTILQQPLGSVLMIAMVIALIGFGIWRLVQSIGDADEHGTDARGLAVRVGLLGSAITYMSLALVAARLLLGWRDKGSDPSGKWINSFLDPGWTVYIVYAVAAVVVIVGGAHIYKGVKASFEKWFDAPESVMVWLRPLSQFGLVARGMVFLIIAALLYYGASHYDPASGNTPGLRDALHAVQDLPFGWVLLGIIALGLASFGAYSLSEAVYRKIGPA